MFSNMYEGNRVHSSLFSARGCSCCRTRVNVRTRESRINDHRSKLVSRLCLDVPNESKYDLRQLRVANGSTVPVSSCTRTRDTKGTAVGVKSRLSVCQTSEKGESFDEEFHGNISNVIICVARPYAVHAQASNKIFRKKIVAARPRTRRNSRPRQRRF